MSKPRRTKKAPKADTPLPAFMEQTFRGWIQTTGDALLILEAARRGLIPRVTRRLQERERALICSGTIFVFDVSLLVPSSSDLNKGSELNMICP